MVPEDYVYTVRVQSIFERLKIVVGAPVLLSELFILDSDSEPWAIALEDGNVALTRGALDIVYGDTSASLDAKDARMAFVLGHELSHIARKDFWHEQIYLGFVNQRSASEGSEGAGLTARRRENELRADEDGFLYASLAGFAMRELFRSIGSENDFLHYWVKQSGIDLSRESFNAQERVDFLANRLKSLDRSVEFFNFGLRLAFINEFEHALVLLEEFFKIFPSHQVLNNLGYIKLQMARQSLPFAVTYQYWYPATQHTSSGIPEIARTMDDTLSDATRSLLLRSVMLLQESIAQNPDNLIASRNLATALIYLGKTTEALAVLQTAMEFGASDPQLQMLEEIAKAQGLKRATQLDNTSVENLIRLTSGNNVTPDLLFNASQLFKYYGEQEKAINLSKRLLSAISTIPPAYRKMLCLQGFFREYCGVSANLPENSVDQWTPENTSGIEVGSRLDEMRDNDRFAQWGTPLRHFIGDTDIEIYRHANGNLMLVENGVVIMIVQKQHSFDFKQHFLDVVDKAGMENVSELRLGSDTILTNDSSWAAWVRGEQILEIWLIDATDF